MSDDRSASHLSNPKFYLGAITILQHAEEALADTGEQAAAYLYAHAYLTPDEAIAPDQPVVNRFPLANDVLLIVITDAARLQTVVLTAEDRPPS